MSKVVFEGKEPKVHESVFLAPGSWIVGDVTIGEGSNVWFGAIIRGDDDTVRIGARTTVLDNCIIEAPTGLPVDIGDDVIVSHGAVVHGAKIGDKVLVGIGAMVLDGAEVGDGSIVGSGALVPPRSKIPPNQLVLGLPGKAIREVRDGEREYLAKEHERTYTKAKKYKAILPTRSHIFGTKRH